MKEGDLFGLDQALGGVGTLGARKMVVVNPYDRATLEAVSRAREEGVIDPVLVGRAGTIVRNAEEAGFDLTGTALEDTADEESAERSASILLEKGADFIMKGLVGTGRFIHVLLDPRWKIRTEKILSHVGLLEIPGSRRLFLMSDGALNIQPNFNRKVQIVLNAIEAARRVGFGRVRVAMLAAVEKVTLPAMPATLDAFLMKKYAETGFFGECDIDGPFAFDNAIDPQRAHTKGIAGKVAGRANVVVVPNVETGNVIWKSVTVLEEREAAGVVLGGSCPIVVPSRSDDTRTKFRSIQFARLLLG